MSPYPSSRTWQSHWTGIGALAATTTSFAPGRPSTTLTATWILGRSIFRRLRTRSTLTSTLSQVPTSYKKARTCRRSGKAIAWKTKSSMKTTAVKKASRALRNPELALDPVASKARGKGLGSPSMARLRTLEFALLRGLAVSPGTVPEDPDALSAVDACLWKP